MNKEEIKELERGRDMLKLIPNYFPVCAEDLEEIFSQNEIQSKQTMGNIGSVAEESSRM